MGKSKSAPEPRGVGRRNCLGWLGILLAGLLTHLPTQGAGGSLPSESQPWFEVRTPTFVLIANLRDRRVIEIARELEVFRRVLEAEIPGLREPSRPVMVYAFDSRRSLRRYYPGAPRSVGGVYLRGEGTDVILIDGGSPLRQQHAYHEYVHFRLRDSFLALPAWLNEGLAYYFQTFRRVDGEAEVGAEVPGLRHKRSTPLRVLLDATTASEHYATRGFARKSWLLVHYLLSRSENAEASLAQLLSGVGDGQHGQRGEAALTEISGLSLTDLEAALNRYSGAGRPKARRILVGGPQAADGPPMRWLEYSGALRRLAELTEAVGGDAATARRLFDEALRRSPADVLALLGSARGLMAAGDLAGAHSRVDEALERNPANALGYLFRGRIAMQEFGAWREDRPDGAPQVLHPSIVKARHAFGHAMLSDPDLLPAVRGYARTFLFDPETRQPGIDACRRALATRNDLDLALTLVELYSDDADRESAHATRQQRVLRLRGVVAIHETKDSLASWTRVTDALVRHDMLLAERLYEAGKLNEAISVLRETRGWATGGSHDRVVALLADMTARSTP